MNSVISRTVMAFTLTMMIPATQATDAACIDPDKARCTIDLTTGIRMAYLEVGPSNGKTVMLLHGLTDSSRSWSTTMVALHSADPTLHLFALDLRGHGASSMPLGGECPASPKNCFQLGQFGADVTAFMKQKGLKRATIVGHSMGSFVAQQIAFDRPELVERIVLVATAADVKGNPVVRNDLLNEPVLGTWKKGLAAKGITSPKAIWNSTPREADSKADAWILANWVGDPVVDPVFIKSVLAETAIVKMGTWIGATEALLDLDNTARFPTRTVPALVLWGAQDPIFHKEPHESDLIAALRTSRAPFVWKQYGSVAFSESGAAVSDIGHNLQWAAPQQVAADILSFIKTGRPTPDHYRAVPNTSGSGFVIATDAGKAMVVSGN